MEQAVLVLEYAVAASFVLLALLTLERWLTFRGRSRGFLALAIGLLALTTVLGRIGPLFPSTAVVVGDLTIVAFMASGFALLLFRHSTMRLPGLALQLAFATAAVTTVLALIFHPQTGTQPTPFQSAVTIAFVLVWCALVGEPAVRMWLLARGRPAVQRARLRALSAGYATFIFIGLVADEQGEILAIHGIDEARAREVLARLGPVQPTSRLVESTGREMIVPLLTEKG